jgi:hypothetical protein
LFAALGYDSAMTDRGAESAAGDGAGLVLITLGSGQFLMTLDSSVMSVAIATVAKDVAFGVPVTILDNAPQLAAMMNDEISGRLKQILLARGNQVILGTGMVSVRRDGDDLAVRLSDGRQLRPDVLRAMRLPSRAHRI